MSGDWHSFEGVIAPLAWGSKTYTILPIPADIITAMPADTRRIEGEFAEHPVNLALTRAPVIEAVFVYTGKTLLRAAQLDPGTPFEARIRPADPDQVDTPQDVTAAFRASGRHANWNDLSAGKRRAHLHLVNTAKRADTRDRRIATLVAQL